MADTRLDKVRSLSPAVTVAAIVGAVVVVLAILGAVTALILTGRNTDELSKFINTTLNTLALFASGGAVIYARAARTAGEQAANATDALPDLHDLDTRIADAVQLAFTQRAAYAGRPETLGDLR